MHSQCYHTMWAYPNPNPIPNLTLTLTLTLTPTLILPLTLTLTRWSRSFPATDAVVEFFARTVRAPPL